MPTIESIKIVVDDDPDPDLSYLGEFAAEQPEDVEPFRIVDRDSRDGTSFHPPNNYRYFVADNVENAEQANENCRRVEKWGYTWESQGITAVANVSVQFDLKQARRFSDFESYTHRGIDSDSETSHKADVAKQELAELRQLLDAYSVDLSKFDELAEAALAEAEF